MVGLSALSRFELSGACGNRVLFLWVVEVERVGSSSHHHGYHDLDVARDSRQQSGPVVPAAVDETTQTHDTEASVEGRGCHDLRGRRRAD